MKKLVFLLGISLVLFSCQKDDSFLGGSKEMDASGMGSAGGGNGQDSTLEPGQITAGEWNDLENWNLWDTLIHGQTYSKMSDHWDMNSEGIVTVSLENKQGEKLVDIAIELLDSSSDVIWESKTDNNGETTLWYKPFANARGLDYKDLSVKILDQIYPLEESLTEGVLTLSNIEHQTSNIALADIGFMVDATGSMSDELEYLKVELMDVIEKVQDAHPDMTLRTGSVFYRDEGDDYVTRVSDFDDRIRTTVDFIKDQRADGGGDFPEAVHTALDKSLNELEWSPEAKARILFMVLDAPPHHENQVIGSIQNRIEDAAKMGIKLIPVVASGIDKETEFLMRYMALFTHGTYVFITNHSGIGGEHLEPTVGQYTVEMLNDLLVRLISENLS